MSIKLDLSQIDLFTHLPLGELQKEYQANGRAFHVSAIEEEGHTYLFDGSKFCEYYLRLRNQSNPQENPENPLTRRNIQHFTIYRFVEEPNGFEQVFTKKEISDLQCLKVLIQDPHRSNAQRGEFYSRIGFALLEADRDEAIAALKEGARFDDRKAQKKLAAISKDESERLYWALRSWQTSESPNIEDFHLCAHAFERCFAIENHDKFAFYFYRKGALKGNPYCIAKIISYYELEYGVSKDDHKAMLWRQMLPVEWQERPIVEFMRHICQDRLILEKSMDHISFPAELLEGIEEIDSNSILPLVEPKEQSKKL